MVLGRRSAIGVVLSDDDAAAIHVYHATKPQRLGEGVVPPDLATTNDFLRFHVSISRGRIDDERISVDSVNTFVEWFFAGFARYWQSDQSRRQTSSLRCKRILNWVVMSPSLKELDQWTRNTLTKEGLVVNKKRQKQLFGG